IGLSLLITACSTTPVTDESSTLYILPIGSTLELHQSLSIEPNRARTFIQYGKVIEEKAIDKYYPYCELEISTLSEQTQIIQPDKFTIYKVIDDEHQTGRYFMYASLSISFTDGPVILGYATEFFLRSKKQPDVRKLICLSWDEPWRGKYLSLTEIKRALGTIASIHPK
ncbi:MAG: hypothetical protein OQK82_05110, partial [Candidatus Pacearchaeota archaeon]|nr:hypothetical protein [Candidatus Pacearchaeota archaeon]